MDTIVLSKEKIIQLMEWKENNKDLVRNAKPVLKKGIIKVPALNIIFKHNITNVHFKIIATIANGSVLMQFNYDLITHHIYDVKESPLFREMKLNNNSDGRYEYNWCADIITTYFASMAYMENFKPQIIEKNFSKNQHKKKNRKSNNGKNKKEKVVKFKEYVIRNIKTETLIKEETKHYERHTEVWKVRGHWREYKKTGKKVWIAEHVKGKAKNRTKDVKGIKYKL